MDGTLERARAAVPPRVLFFRSLRRFVKHPDENIGVEQHQKPLGFADFIDIGDMILRTLFLRSGTLASMINPFSSVHIHALGFQGIYV